MHTGNAQQNPVGNPVRSLNIVYNPHTGHADWSGCRRCKLAVGRRRVCVRRDGHHTPLSANTLCGSGSSSGTGSPHHPMSGSASGSRSPNTPFLDSVSGPAPTASRGPRILFIGEAPGATENATGVPFTGTAGRILNVMFSFVHSPFEFCITNTVCCQPMDIMELYDAAGEPVTIDEDHEAIEFLSSPGTSYAAFNHNRDPSKKEIELCRPHLNELMKSFSPRGVVYLGAVARNSYPITSIPTLSLLHPAFIARQEFKLLTVRREAVKLDAFLKSLS